MKKLLLFIPILLSVFVSLPVSAASVTPLCSFTFDGSNTIHSSTQYCDNYLNSIKYVEIEYGVDSSVNEMTVTYNTVSYNNRANRNYILIGVDNLPYSYIQNGAGYSDTYPLTVSFYDQFPGGSCPEPEPCPDCEDCDHPPFIDMVITAFWQYLSAFAGVVTSLIVIVFVFKYIKKVFK